MSRMIMKGASSSPLLVVSVVGSLLYFGLVILVIGGI